MIVNTSRHGWTGILQRAHAWIAYRLLLDFRPELRSPRWDAVLHAALTHDHGWMEWKEATLEADGRPSTFTDSPSDLAQRLARRSVNLATWQCAEGAILVARHMEELYQNREEADLLEVIDHIRRQRLKQMERLKLIPSEVESDYEYVYWADSASLTLCVEDPEFRAHLPLKLHGTEYLMREAKENWTMFPWPYDSPTLNLGVTLYEFQSSKIATESDLRGVIQKDSKLRKSWILEPGEER